MRDTTNQAAWPGAARRGAPSRAAAAALPARPQAARDAFGWQPEASPYKSFKPDSDRIHPWFSSAAGLLGISWGKVGGGGGGGGGGGDMGSGGSGS
jgi:hypothetical protein